MAVAVEAGGFSPTGSGGGGSAAVQELRIKSTAVKTHNNGNRGCFKVNIFLSCQGILKKTFP
jgi:hypothetical protein